MCDRDAAGKRENGAVRIRRKEKRGNRAARIRRKKSRENGAVRTGRKERFADSFAAAERTNKTFVLLNTGKSGIDENLPCRPAG